MKARQCGSGPCFNRRVSGCRIGLRGSGITPGAVAPRTPPAAFQTVVVDGQKVVPTWYVESVDGKRCLTVVSTALAGEGLVTFRLWQTSAKPLGDAPGISQTELAACLGSTEGAVKVAVHRLRKSFRDTQSRPRSPGQLPPRPRRRRNSAT
jgi:hypothetical protein